METELRIYTLKPGSLEAFVAAWRQEVLPLRERCGFLVTGAWHSEDGEEFVWQLAHEGARTLREQEDAYAAIRSALTFADDPARYVDAVQVRFLEPLDGLPI